MDEQTARAKAYCESQLRKRDNPTAVDIDDLVQEYLLAELEGNDPRNAVGRVLRRSAKDARMVESNPRMGFAVDAEIDLDASDEEQAEYIAVEEEIHVEVKAEQVATLHKLLTQLLPQEAEALRLVMDGQDDEAISENLSVTVKQARYLREAGVKRLQEVANPDEVDLALFPGLVDQRVKPRETYKRTPGPRHKPQVTDAILGAA